MMYIHEAVKQALTEGKAIARVGKFGAIIPTDTPYFCIIHARSNERAYFSHEWTDGGKWNPNIEDLKADDWKVVDID